MNFEMRGLQSCADSYCGLVDCDPCSLVFGCYHCRGVYCLYFDEVFPTCSLQATHG